MCLFYGLVVERLAAGVQLRYGPGMARELTKITVNLIPAAAAALWETVELTSYSRTDVINRALQVYAMLERQQRVHGKELLFKSEDQLERVIIT